MNSRIFLITLLFFCFGFPAWSQEDTETEDVSEILAENGWEMIEDEPADDEAEISDIETADGDASSVDLDAEFPDMEMEMLDEPADMETFFDDEVIEEAASEEPVAEEIDEMPFEMPDEPADMESEMETFFDDEFDEMPLEEPLAEEIDEMPMDEPIAEEIDEMPFEMSADPETFFDDDMEIMLEEPMDDEDALDELPSDIEMAEDVDVTLEFPGQDVSEAALSLEEDTITVEFPDEEVRTIISNVADLFELNVVIPDTLVGSTTLKLRNVSWQQVFDVVLEPLGYTWVRDRNIIKIKSQEELLQEPVETRVFVINFATAGEMQASISPLVDSAAGGRIQVDARSNSLVITERPSRFNNIQTIIDRLDRPNAQVMIESKFIEVTKRAVENQGINWQSLNSYQVSAGPFNRSWNESNNQTRGDSRADTLNSNANDTSNLTRSVTDGLATVTDDLTSNVTSNNIIDQTLNLVNSAAQGRLDSAVFSAPAFNVVLSFLNTLSDTELVSNPTVVTVNNTPALIAIGERFPVPEYNYNDERGTFEVSGFEYQDIGINLKVTPQVNSAGFINLDIQPEVSSRQGEVNFGGASGAQIPIIASRRTESTITIKDGFTLAIGGLIEKTTQNGGTKVPVFGDVPIVGRFFRSKSDDEFKRNLIIFITAKTLNPDGSTYEDVFSSRALSDLNITPSDVPGYEIPDSEVQLHAQIREATENVNRAKREINMQKHLDKLTPQEKSAKKRAKEEVIDSTGTQIPSEDKKNKKFFLFGKKGDQQAGG